MKEITDRITKLCRAMLVLGPIAIVAGLPPLWVGICFFLILDISSIAMMTSGSSSGDSGLRQTRSRQHQEIVAGAAA
jgi:hypothetical protein